MFKVLATTGAVEASLSKGSQFEGSRLLGICPGGYGQFPMKKRGECSTVPYNLVLTSTAERHPVRLKNLPKIGQFEKSERT